MAKATALALKMKNPGNIVLVPPEARIKVIELVSDNEKLAQNIDSAFEPARTLEEEEDVFVDDILYASASTVLLMQLLTTFPSLMMICPIPNQLAKEDKQHQINIRKGWIQLNRLKGKT